MKNKFLCIVSILFLANTILANPIDTNTAKSAVKTFWESTYTSSLQKSNIDYQLIYQAKSNQKDNNQKTFYYVYNVSDKGFVIISADDRVVPILGYSNESSFNPNQIPPSLSEILTQYQQTIEYVIKNNIAASEEITVSWQNLKNGIAIYQKATQTTVEPLIKTNWSQSKPYNNNCPYDNSQNKRCVTGCVATAMAQVIYFWKSPAHGYGSHYYTHSTYGTLSADFKNTTYEYDSMQLCYADSTIIVGQDEIATLMYHCGVSVNMNYGVDASGAQLIENEYGINNAERALHNYFGFYEAYGRYKSDFSESEWINMLKNNLDSSQPIVYAGSNIGSHAFVCDGYDENNYFHFNWGWNGHYNGYFLLTDISPADCDFSGNQQAIFNIKKSSLRLHTDSHNIIYVTLEGSGTKDGSSWENATNQLNYALANVIESPHTIWVKSGTYYGDTNAPTAFYLYGGNKMYGGFAGNEPADYDLSLRKLDSNKTILNGQHTQQVIKILQSTEELSVCDGFTICNGYISSYYSLGAGVYMEPNSILINCIIENNTCESDYYSYGAGVITYGNAMINCIIRKNTSDDKAGGVYILHDNFFMINCVVADNIAYKSGGGVVSSSTTITFINCDIIKNIAGTDGGGIVCAKSLNEIYNTIIWGNSPDQFNYETDFLPYNTAIQNYDYAEENINLDVENDGTDTSKRYVRFKSLENDNYQLMKSSPCINTGDNNLSCFDTLTTDLYGNKRIQHNTIDIGACEYNYGNFVQNISFDESVLIYPNPASTYIDIIFMNNLTQTYTMSLFDINGKLVYNQSINNKSTHIKLPDLSKGIYNLKLINENSEQRTYKIVVK